jgi:anti-sigma factor RsiW
MRDPCPEDEALGAYMDHVLSPERQAEVESHLITCRICREVLALAIKSKTLVPDPVITK